jgi:hypothetical protein
MDISLWLRETIKIKCGLLGYRSGKCYCSNGLHIASTCFRYGLMDGVSGCNKLVVIYSPHNSGSTGVLLTNTTEEKIGP